MQDPCTRSVDKTVALKISAKAYDTVAQCNVTTCLCLVLCCR